MHYICVENNLVTGIFNYKPAAPKGVEVFEINHVEHNTIMHGTHYFDLEEKKVLPVPEEAIAARQAEQRKKSGKAYLQETDWLVMRHIREKALQFPTTLSEVDYLALEQRRHDAAKSVVK